MSMVTGAQGNKGNWYKNGTTQQCDASPKDKGKACYFSTDVRGTAAGGFGQKIHTLKQESGTNKTGLPNTQHKMWNHYDLQNKCPTNNIKTCRDNSNCKINDNLIVKDSIDGKVIGQGVGYKGTKETYDYLRNTYKGGINNDVFWKDKWNEIDDKGKAVDICGWSGVNCKNSFVQGTNIERQYIDSIDIPNKYFKNPNETLEQCETRNPSLSQNQWVQKQSQNCSALDIDRACSDNKFCAWKEESKKCYDTTSGEDVFVAKYNEADCSKHDKHEWKVGEKELDKSKYKHYEHFYESGAEATDSNYKKKVTKGTCSLDTKYHKVSGLNKDDEFKKDKTLSDVLDRINNGRVSDANITSNVTHTRRGDVLMEHDNQKTAVKGIIDETALSTIFFSEVNTNIIQQTLRYKVYKQTNMVVDYQSPEALYIVMRSIMLQFGNFKVNSEDLALEIRKLNFLVINYCVKEVSSNTLQYKGYLSDLKKLPTPMDRPGYNDHSSRNKSYNMSNHISVNSGWGFRHRDRGD